MPTFPLLDIQRIESAGIDTANSRGTVVTGAGTINTKGSYTQLVASTAFPAKGIIVNISQVTTTTDCLVDIAVGGASAEKVIISNLLISMGNQLVTESFFFPIEIPAGTRISARLQATSINRQLYISCELLGGGMAQAESFSGVETIGAATSDSGGTSVDPGGTINTKGAYVQLTASCAHNLRGLMIAPGFQTNNVRFSALWLVDVAVGAAGSEKIIISNIPLHYQTSLTPMPYGFVPIQIPAGTRIAIAAQCTINDASDRLLDFVLYGVY